MRYLILSDIHANAHALNAVLDDASRLGYDRTLCLGDLVGYGGAPAECIERTFALAPVGLIRGNHDKVCAGLESPALFNDVARKSVEWTRSVLSAGDLARLAALEPGPKVIARDLEICHGSPFDEDHYIFDASDAERAILTMTARLCFFGHTHVPAVFTSSRDPMQTGGALEPDEMRLPKRGPALINVGSVGQPRDGDARAAYGLFDVTRRTVRLRRVTYDIRGAQQQILRAGLPTWLATRLERGQ